MTEPADRTRIGSETVRTSTMDYEAYTPDSTSRLKSGYAYRVLGHDAATYYQYAIYVRVPPASRTIPTRARRPSKRVTERLAVTRTARPNRRGERRWCHRFVEARDCARLDAHAHVPARRGRPWPRQNRDRTARAARAHPAAAAGPFGCAPPDVAASSDAHAAANVANRRSEPPVATRSIAPVDRSTGVLKGCFLDFLFTFRERRRTDRFFADDEPTDHPVIVHARRVAGGRGLGEELVQLPSRDQGLAHGRRERRA